MSESTKIKSKQENGNNNVSDILSGAKKNFLSATDSLKSPYKQQNSSATEDVVSSPKSLIKCPAITLGTPPKKPKFWKTRWQEKINGKNDRGRRKRTNEADKLLVDEGVIQMLSKVPSVFGEMPRPSSSTSGRIQRARAAASKPVQAAKIGNKRSASTDSKKIKLDIKLASKKNDKIIESKLSPKRAVRNISKDLISHDVVGVMKDDDSVSHLSQLPCDQLEHLMNCNIRYSLPRQGAPAAEPSVSSKVTKAGYNKKISSSDSSDVSSAALVKVRPSNNDENFATKLPTLVSSPTKRNAESRIQVYN